MLIDARMISVRRDGSREPGVGGVPLEGVGRGAGLVVSLTDSDLVGDARRPQCADCRDPDRGSEGEHRDRH